MNLAYKPIDINKNITEWINSSMGTLIPPKTLIKRYLTMHKQSKAKLKEFSSIITVDDDHIRNLIREALIRNITKY